MADSRTFNQTKSDIPFAREDANRFLPWVIALMICLTALILATAISINLAVTDGRDTYIDSFHVQIPYAESGRAERVDKVVQALKTLPQVAEVQVLEPNDLHDLIEPWLGNRLALDSLPIPALLEVQIDNAVSPALSYDRLEDELDALVPGVEVDSHAEWIEQFKQFSLLVQTLAITLGLLLLATTIAIVVLASRTSLKLHFKTVNILHSIGAEDDYIVRQFQWNSLRLALQGAAIGTMIALILYLLVSIYAGESESPALPQLRLSFAHGAMFAILPLVTGMVSFVSTRINIRALLRKMH